jgi:glycosyltransferase involved in cell wall biosynthesis
MTGRTLLKILVLIRGGVGPQMRAPGIRAWEMAKVLAGSHDVTVAASTPREEKRDGVRLIPNSRRRLVREARHHDVLIAQGVPPYLLVALANSGTRLVADLYYPAERELASETDRPEVARFLARALAFRRLQLRFADLVLCSGERQKEDLLADSERLAPWRPEPPPVQPIPFGIPGEPPTSTEQPIRERIPEIGASDPLVLWWGEIWPWFDAEAAIRSFASVLRRGLSAKLLFASGRATSWDKAPTERARSLAASLGLLGRDVFFLDDWVPYENRHAYLQEADVGLTLHKHAREASLAMRSRYMDYLWASLPCVVGAGDELGEQFEHVGFGRAVQPDSTEDVADALTALLQDRAARERAGEAGRRLAESYRWPAVVQPLLESVEELVGRERPRAMRRSVLYHSKAYYAIRFRPRAPRRSARREPTSARG